MEIQAINEISKRYGALVCSIRARLLDLMDIHGPDADTIKRHLVVWKYDPSKEIQDEDDDPETAHDGAVFDVLTSEVFKDLSLEEIMAFVQRAYEIEEYAEEREQELERQCIEYLEERERERNQRPDVSLVVTHFQLLGRR
jgi:hypothetical protein